MKFLSPTLVLKQKIKFTQLPLNNKGIGKYSLFSLKKNTGFIPKWDLPKHNILLWKSGYKASETTKAVLFNTLRGGHEVKSELVTALK